MSRAAYAKLQSAKFPSILDRFGKIAEVIDGTTYQQFDMKREEADMLACNQIMFQFLAYSVNLDSLQDPSKHDSKPKGVFFTFQFYRFPEFKTPKLVLFSFLYLFSLFCLIFLFFISN
jgi:nephrocystin-4